MSAALRNAVLGLLLLVALAIPVYGWVKHWNAYVNLFLTLAFVVDCAVVGTSLSALTTESALKRTTPECTCFWPVNGHDRHRSDCAVLRPPTPEGDAE